MENNILSKRLWSIMRVFYFMLRKSVSKRKLMFDLNLMMKRGKVAGKAITNLIMLHHTHNPNSKSSHDPHVSFDAPNEYEFSCDNSPAALFQLTTTKRGNKHNFFACAHSPKTQDDEIDAVRKVLEMFNANDQIVSVEASPALAGFGRTPASVQQLRVTDSPFPVNNIDDDHRVDRAAEDFIAKFYKELKKQKIMGSPSLW